jgi:hypothetical protein
LRKSNRNILETDKTDVTDPLSAPDRPSSSSSASTHDSTYTDPDPQYIHDPVYFLDDGDIILRAGKTLFRVHLERLKSVKGFFEELFSLPQPDDAERVYGVICCDVLELMSPNDVRYIVGFIYKDL